MPKYDPDTVRHPERVYSQIDEAIRVVVVSSSDPDESSVPETTGSINDAATVGDTAGTISAKLRGLTKILNDVWNTASKSLRAGQVIAPSNNFTRPNDTTAYAVGDLVANDTVAGNVVPIALTIGAENDLGAMLRRLRLKINGTAWFGATIRVHLFRDAPVPTVGDNAAFSVVNGAGFTLSVPESSYLGSVDIVLLTQFTDGVKGITAQEINTIPSAGTKLIYALLETRTAVVPVAQKIFTLTCETVS